MAVYIIRTGDDGIIQVAGSLKRLFSELKRFDLLRGTMLVKTEEGWEKKPVTQERITNELSGDPLQYSSWECPCIDSDGKRYDNTDVNIEKWNVAR